LITRPSDSAAAEQLSLRRRALAHLSARLG